MTTTYVVTITDHAAQEVHGDPETTPTVVEAKDRAAKLLHRIYADAPADVTATVDDLIDRVRAHRGELTEYDPFLDCTVEILAAVR